MILDRAGTAKKKKKDNRETALIIDGNNYIWRAHYALPETFAKDGSATNAIKGFMVILAADLRHMKPDYLVVVFDATGGTGWRKELLPQYKGTRGDNPELRDQVYGQIKPIKDLLKSLGVKVVVKKGHEADDTMATLAVNFSDLGIHALISSNDKDMAQVVRPNISRLEQNTRRVMNVKETIEKFGVHPDKFIEYLMLLGDGADNIPGVHKCGPKTASKLLNTHGSIKNVLKNINKLTPALRKNILAVKHQFKVTRKVITVCSTVNINTAHHKFRLDSRTIDETRFYSMCKSLGLTQTRKDLEHVLL